MGFIKIYSTSVPNAAITLAKRVPILPLLGRIKSESVRSSLSQILEHGSINFWDFGVRATPQLSVNDSVRIICGGTCYSGHIVHIISDPTGELGDTIGWVRMFKAPWRNVCALTINSSAHLNGHEIALLLQGARQTESNFYSIPATTRKSEALIEGNIAELTLTVYERNPAARSACLDHYGTRCQVCGLDFGDVYGELGRGFIHVHHITPLSAVREAHAIDPVRDLVPVCPNCHAMLHIRQGEPLQVGELRNLMAANSG